MQFGFKKNINFVQSKYCRYFCLICVLIYTKEKTRDNAYKVKTTVNGVEHTFNCVVANDTEADLKELLQWNIDNLSAPFVEPQLSYADKIKSEYPKIEDYIDESI